MSGQAAHEARRIAVNIAKLPGMLLLPGRCRIFATVLKQNTAFFLTTHEPLQISSFSLIAPLAVGLALSGCATGQTPLASTEAPSSSAGVSIGQRDLTSEEKKVIMDAVAQSLRNPSSAKYQWAKFPAVVTEGSVNYCATVDAQSPHAAYNGRQAYVVQVQMSGNRVSSAVGRSDRWRQGFCDRHQYVREIRPRSAKRQLAGPWGRRGTSRVLQ